jgi:hypothetical protein
MSRSTCFGAWNPNGDHFGVDLVFDIGANTGQFAQQKASESDVAGNSPIDNIFSRPCQ